MCAMTPKRRGRIRLGGAGRCNGTVQSYCNGFGSSLRLQTCAAGASSGDVMALWCPRVRLVSLGAFSPTFAAVSIPGALILAAAHLQVCVGAAAGSACRSAPERSNWQPGAVLATSSDQSPAAAIDSSG